LIAVIYGLEDFVSRRHSSCNQWRVCSVYRSYSDSLLKLTMTLCLAYECICYSGKVCVNNHHCRVCAVSRQKICDIPLTLSLTLYDGYMKRTKHDRPHVYVNYLISGRTPT